MSTVNFTQCDAFVQSIIDGTSTAQKGSASIIAFVKANVTANSPESVQAFVQYADTKIKAYVASIEPQRPKNAGRSSPERSAWNALQVVAHNMLRTFNAALSRIDGLEKKTLKLSLAKGEESVTIADVKPAATKVATAAATVASTEKLDDAAVIAKIGEVLKAITPNADNAKALQLVVAAWMNPPTAAPVETAPVKVAKPKRTRTKK